MMHDIGCGVQGAGCRVLGLGFGSGTHKCCTLYSPDAWASALTVLHVTYVNGAWARFITWKP